MILHLNLHLTQSALNGLGQGLHSLFFVLAVADQINLSPALNAGRHDIQHALSDDFLLPTFNRS